MANYIIYQDASPPLSYVYPSRVIDGTPTDTILKLMYVDFFRTAGMTRQATEMEAVAPGGEHELFENLIETAIASARGGKLIVGGDDSLRLSGMTLTTLRGEGLSPSARPPAEFFERFQRHLEKALQVSARSDPNVREAIRYVTTPVKDTPPRIIYRMNETLTDLKDRQGYSKALYTAFRIQTPGEDKPKIQARKPDILTEAFQNVAKILKEEPVGAPTTGAEAEATTGAGTKAKAEEGTQSDVGAGVPETETAPDVTAPFVDAIRRDLQLEVSPDGSVTALPSLVSGAPPMTYPQWLEILKFAVQTSRGALLAQFPSMILPSLGTNNVVRTAEMLGEIIGSKRDPQRQADLQVFREEAPEEEIQGKEGALAPLVEIPDVVNPFDLKSYVPLKGVRISMALV
jgi:hypothetical protein